MYHLTHEFNEGRHWQCAPTISSPFLPFILRQYFDASTFASEQWVGTHDQYGIGPSFVLSSFQMFPQLVPVASRVHPPVAQTTAKKRPQGRRQNSRAYNGKHIGTYPAAEHTLPVKLGSLAGSSNLTTCAILKCKATNATLQDTANVAADVTRRYRYKANKQKPSANNILIQEGRR